MQAHVLLLTNPQLRCTLYGTQGGTCEHLMNEEKKHIRWHWSIPIISVTLGLLAVIFSIVSWVTWRTMGWEITVCYWSIGPLGALSIAFGVTSLIDKAKTQGTKATAIFGIILGILAILLAVGLLMSNMAPS